MITHTNLTRNILLQHMYLNKTESDYLVNFIYNNLYTKGEKTIPNRSLEIHSLPYTTVKLNNV